MQVTGTHVRICLDSHVITGWGKAANGNVQSCSKNGRMAVGSTDQAQYRQRLVLSRSNIWHARHWCRHNPGPDSSLLSPQGLPSCAHVCTGHVNSHILTLSQVCPSSLPGSNLSTFLYKCRSGCGNSPPPGQWPHPSGRWLCLAGSGHGCSGD